MNPRLYVNGPSAISITDENRSAIFKHLQTSVFNKR